MAWHMHASPANNLFRLQCISDGRFLIAWLIALSLLPNCGIKYPLRRPLKLENMVVQPPELLQIQLTPLTVVQPQNNI